MKQTLSLLLLLVCTAIACKHPKKPDFIIQPRDTTITRSNAYIELFFDSTAMEKFITQKNIADSLADRIRSFYNNRNYQYAWFDSTGIEEYASSFLNMQSSYIYYSKDSSVYRPFLQQLLDSVITDTTYTINPGKRLQAELELTTGFFQYANRAYQGDTSLNLKELSWFIPRKKIDMVDLLDSLVTENGKTLSNYEPVNRQYNLLKLYLLSYYQIQKQGGWDSIIADNKVLKEGDSSATISRIKQRLFITGDMKEKDSSGNFTPTLTRAVKSYQHRYGLQEDGVIGKNFWTELNRPISHRIRQLLINMERIRWMPANLPSDYLLVNIPAYKLFIYEKGQLAWDMNVVVGSAAHNTVIFNGDIKYIVFSPYWNVPPGILRNEILPGIRRDRRYLARHNMEWHNGTVRQKPGPGNALGLVKFLFPNSYNIYLHDTPAKSLFNEPKRAFSHGCIRLAEAQKLAEYILRNDSIWTTEKINRAMHSGREKFVTLKQTIPVFIGYFTTWVDSKGQLHFRDDIYGHDKRMEKQMFVNEKN